MNNCIYCKNDYRKNTEHVFPKGLGGEDVFCSFICSSCNSKLSKLETELYQKSLIAFERSIQGMDGYHKLQGKKGQFKPHFLLYEDPKTRIVYEIGQYGKLETYLLPQIIDIDGSFYMEGEVQEDFILIKNLFNYWRKNSLQLVSGQIIKGYVDNLFEVQKSNASYLIENIQIKHKVKNEIRIDLMEKSHDLYNTLKPRLYIDRRDPEKPKLRIRAKTLDDALAFIVEFLLFVDTGKEIRSYPDKNFEEPYIQVGLTFNMLYFEKAIVKIALNCLLHYYGKNINGNGIENAIEFVINENEKGLVNFGKKNDLLDSIDNSHNIFFYQYENLLSVRVSLFNGNFVFGFSINDLQVMKVNEYSRFVNEYHKKRNRFQNQSEFLIQTITLSEKEKQPLSFEV